MRWVQTRTPRSFLTRAWGLQTRAAEFADPVEKKIKKITIIIIIVIIIVTN